MVNNDKHTPSTDNTLQRQASYTISDRPNDTVQEVTECKRFGNYGKVELHTPIHETVPMTDKTLQC